MTLSLLNLLPEEMRSRPFQTFINFENLGHYARTLALTLQSKRRCTNW